MCRTDDKRHLKCAEALQAQTNRGAPVSQGTSHATLRFVGQVPPPAVAQQFLGFRWPGRTDIVFVQRKLIKLGSAFNKRVDDSPRKLDLVTPVEMGRVALDSVEQQPFVGVTYHAGREVEVE